MKLCAATTIWEMQQLTNILQHHMVLDPDPIYVEIGSRHGASLQYIYSILPDTSLIAIDFDNAPKFKIAQKKELKNANLEVIIGDSHSQKILSQLKKILNGRPIDTLLIDGDHTYDGAKADVEMYTPLVRKNGLIIFHDCGLETDATRDSKVVPPVRKCFQEFIKNKPYILLQEHVGLGIVWNRPLEKWDKQYHKVHNK